MTDHEAYLRYRLRRLQLDYEREAKPIREELARIHAMSLAPTIVLPVDQVPEFLKAKATGGKA